MKKNKCEIVCSTNYTFTDFINLLRMLCKSVTVHIATEDCFKNYKKITTI